MSDDLSEIQKLLRLKRYERPRDGYFEDFLDEFQSRQRSELLRRSARSLLMERLGTYFSGVGRQRWWTGAGVAYAALMIGVFAWRGGSAEPEDLATKAAGEPGGVLWQGEVELASPMRLLDGSVAPVSYGRGQGAMFETVIDLDAMDANAKRRRVVYPAPSRILPVSLSDEVIAREY